MDLVIEYANAPFRQTFNLKEGKILTELKTDPDLGVIIRNLIGKRYSSFHFDLYLQNSSEGFFVEMERVLIADRDFFVITFFSIAERKKLEERINNLHYALEYGFLPVVTLDAEGKLNYSTDSFERLLGKKIQQLYGRHITEILSSYISDESKEKLNETLARRTVWKTVVIFEKNGKQLFYELLLKPIVYEYGKVKGFVLSANDVSEHIEHLRMIEKNEKRKRLIINSISEPLVIIRKENEKFIFENANEIFFNLFEIDSQKVLETDFLNFPDEELIDALLTAIDRLLYDKKQSLKIKISHKRTEKEFFCKISAFGKEEKVCTFVISFFDITQQIENEKQLRAAYEKEMRLNKLKSAFLANMSHEVRTPLNAIIGYADLLEYEIQEMEDSNLTELTTYLKDGAKRLVKLVENIIDVSKIESGDFEFSYAEVDITEIFEKFRREFSKIAEMRGIEFIFDIDEKYSVIETDATVFEKIFWELIDNAVKYNIDKGKVIIKSYPVADMLRIEVIDTGRGISKEMLEDVLQPFTQDDLEGYTRRYEGAGLGLTFAYKVTKMMGGEFEIRSEEGHGTKVVVTLPRKKTIAQLTD
jgi:PAS domain S-box-containing protein